MKRLRELAVSALLVALSLPAWAATVCPSGCDFTSIRQASQATIGGEVVIMETGIYTEAGIPVGTTSSAAVIRSKEPKNKQDYISKIQEIIAKLIPHSEEAICWNLQIKDSLANTKLAGNGYSGLEATWKE